jgi:hypothetical protein
MSAWLAPASWGAGLWSTSVQNTRLDTQNRHAAGDTKSDCGLSQVKKQFVVYQVILETYGKGHGGSPCAECLCVALVLPLPQGHGLPRTLARQEGARLL